MYCPLCRTENDDSNNYCYADGYPLHTDIGRLEKQATATEDFCPSCGNKNRTSSAYCNKCGTNAVNISATKKVTPAKAKATSISLPKVAVGEKDIRQSAITGLIAAGIGVVLMLLLSFAVMTYVEDFIVKEAAEDGVRLNTQMLRDGSIIKMAVEEDLMVDEGEFELNLSKIYGVTTMVTLLNGVDLQATVDYSDDMYDYIGAEKISLKVTNNFVVGMIAMVIALAGIGLYIGIRARKYKESIIAPLVVGISVYGVFVMICAWNAKIDLMLNSRILFVVPNVIYWTDCYRSSGVVHKVWQDYDSSCAFTTCSTKIQYFLSNNLQCSIRFIGGLFIYLLNGKYTTNIC